MNYPPKKRVSNSQTPCVECGKQGAFTGPDTFQTKISQSQKNPNRAFLSCPYQHFICWVDQAPPPVQILKPPQQQLYTPPEYTPTPVQPPSFELLMRLEKKLDLLIDSMKPTPQQE